MVRSFDGDGDGALCARDVDDLMEHFGVTGLSVRSDSRRIAPRRRRRRRRGSTRSPRAGAGEGGEECGVRQRRPPAGSAGFREVAGRGGAGSRDPCEERRRALTLRAFWGGGEQCANSAGGWVGVGTVRAGRDVVYNRCLIE